MRRAGRRLSAERTESTCESESKTRFFANLLLPRLADTGMTTKEVRYGEAPLSCSTQS